MTFFHMRYHLFLHYGWFLQNLGKDFIPSIMHTTVLFPYLYSLINHTFFFFTVVVIFLFFLYLTTSFVSIWGNSLVIWVIYTTRSMQDVNNYFIANLALSDITISALCTPFQFYAALVQRQIYE